MRLHKIQVEKFVSFLLNKHSTIARNVSSSTSLARSLKCIIPAYCIHQSFDKHNLRSV